MPKKGTPGGTVHKLPADFQKTLIVSPTALTTWRNITPLARNEWICWVESVKRDETRKQHIQRAITELKQGKRRPCCWYGCVHRKDKPMSPSVRGVLKKRSKKKI